MTQKKLKLENYLTKLRDELTDFESHKVLREIKDYSIKLCQKEYEKDLAEIKEENAKLVQLNDDDY